jgi:LacI family transcriptional regulator
MYVSDGIDKAAEEAKTYGVIIEKHFFNQYDKNAFEKATKKIMNTELDGIVIANFFRESVINISKKLDEAGIPYVYIDTNIEEQNQLAYFGTNSFDSGALAAYLMLERTGKNKDILITKVFHKQHEFSNQVINREKGFMDFISKTDFAGEIVEVHLGVDAPLQNFDKLDKIFFQNKHLAIAGAITFNSSCHILANYLKVRDFGKIYVVGYDLIEKNRALLKEGIIKLLICQRPESQGFNAIKALTSKIILGIDPEKINFMPIDLLIKQNVDYYKDF